MNNVYHITTPITESQLIGAQRVAKAQEERILALFRANPHSSLSPRQVEKALTRLHNEHGGPMPPLLTSIRRALSNLTRDGALVHHKTLHVTGPYRMPETLWGLNNSPARS